MSEKEGFKRLALRTALMTVALLAALGYGILLLAAGDWVPASIIVVASLVGLATEIPTIRKLCSEGPPPSPPRSRPTS